MGDEATANGLDPEGHYSAEDLMVSTEVALPGREGPGHAGERLPAREVLYEILREQGEMSLAELTRQYLAVSPGGVRPPYDERPEAWVLRLLAGRRAGRSLATIEDVVRDLVADPGPDPDYGFEVRPG
ncbi:MAG: hypothetical protein MUE51_13925 [Thermoleophilia bacterium]|jgi:hypothetical protein|nr:hypothetical protein [Thermoleophilia bacterium]